jgi:hypothetical protein
MIITNALVLRMALARNQHASAQLFGNHSDRLPEAWRVRHLRCWAQSTVIDRMQEGVDWLEVLPLLTKTQCAACGANMRAGVSI